MTSCQDEKLKTILQDIPHFLNITKNHFSQFLLFFFSLNEKFKIVLAYSDFCSVRASVVKVGKEIKLNLFCSSIKTYFTFSQCSAEIEMLEGENFHKVKVQNEQFFSTVISFLCPCVERNFQFLTKPIS
jgi:hypothetical protein